MRFIDIVDTTVRDGEQTRGVSFKHEEKLVIVKRLLADGKSVQEIGKQLGMRPEEVFRLSDFSRDDFLSMMTKGVHGYSKAELLTKY